MSLNLGVVGGSKKKSAEEPQARIAACRREIEGLEREIAQLSGRIEHQQRERKDFPLVLSNAGFRLQRFDHNIGLATAGREEAASRLEERQARLRAAIADERALHGGQQGPGEAYDVGLQHVRTLPPGGARSHLHRFNDDDENAENAEERRLGVSRMPMSQMLQRHASDEQRRVLAARFPPN